MGVCTHGSIAPNQGECQCHVASCDLAITEAINLLINMDIIVTLRMVA